MTAAEDTALIAAAEDKTLAQWWCVLNRFQWPDAIPNPEKPAPSDILGSRRSRLMRLIEDRIGFRECLREWNRPHMTSDAFDAWWDAGRDPVKLLPKQEPA